MKCEHCKEKTATFHKREEFNGMVNETHLCAACAAQMKEPMFKSFSIGEFFPSFNLIDSDFENPKPITKKCKICQTKLSDLHKTGFVGCSNCYCVFSDELTPIINSTQGRNACHTGKNGGNV